MPPKKSAPTRTLSDRSSVQRIISTARRQFFAHGFRTVSMDDLAAELGMSKKTLYAFFSSKKALVEAVLKDKFGEVEMDFGRLAKEHASDVEVALTHFLGCLQRHTAEIQPAFVRDVGRETPDLFQMVETHRRDMIRRYFGSLFDEGRKVGVIRKDIPVHLIIEILLGAVQSIMNPHKLTELGLTLETGYSAIIRVILEGALAARPQSVS